MAEFFAKLRIFQGQAVTRRILFHVWFHAAAPGGHIHFFRHHITVTGCEAGSFPHWRPGPRIYNPL